MRKTQISLPGLMIAFVFLCFVGCTGRGNESAGRDARPTDSPSPLAPSTFTLEPSPLSLPVPEGVDNAVWQQLTAELERQLITVRGASKVGDELLLRSVSTPPTRP